MISFRNFTPFSKVQFNTLKYCVLVSSRSGVANGVLEIGDLGGRGGGEEHAFVTKIKKSVHCRSVTSMCSQLKCRIQLPSVTFFRLLLVSV